MTALLLALGRPPTNVERLRVIGLIAAWMAFFLVVGESFALVGIVAAAIFQIVTWAMWFAWQALVFPRNRTRYLEQGPDPASAYRRAFYTDIVIGASYGVAQMMRPGIHGLVEVAFTPSAWLLALSLVCYAVGLTLLWTGFTTIGFDGAGFLYEFIEPDRPFVRRGVFGWIRHPLFFGGIVMSVAAGLLFASPLPLLLTAINVAILPVYAVIEHRRLRRVLGATYAEYRRLVPAAFVPRLASRREETSSVVTRT